MFMWSFRPYYMPTPRGRKAWALQALGLAELGGSWDFGTTSNVGL